MNNIIKGNDIHHDGEAGISFESDIDRLTKWRLILGGGEADGTDVELAPLLLRMDKALGMLYGGGDGSEKGKGSSSASMPNVSRWLGDIREFFPSSVVRVIQKDAMERLNLKKMLLEPEMLNSVEPDVNLVSTLVSLAGVMPKKSKETARIVINKVVNELMKKLDEPMKSAIKGALNRAEKNRRPRFSEMNWDRTIRANLKNYQEKYKTIIPETLIGYGRKSRKTMREIILCIDQSGSMANSVVYSSVFGAVMASLPAVRTRLVVFDTSVVDLTEKIEDPVEVLFGVQLGGGTFINKAVGYCQELIREPKNTIFILISDLYEGGVEKELLQRTSEMVESGIQFIALLALSDEGAPSYDHNLAEKLSTLGVPCFACTPDLFPDMMAAAIKRENLNQWASDQNICATRSKK